MSKYAHRDGEGSHHSGGRVQHAANGSNRRSISEA
jgi:hypothetical protein